MPIIVVVGPTAAGKTDLAVSIAGWFDGEIVSADAFQVYRGLDVGTAKVDSRIADRVPHHCVDIVDPDEHYTAGRYACDAAAAIEDIRSRGRMPVIAGGSGFYIRALIDGLAPLPSHDERWRRALETVSERRGSAYMFEMLRRLDPDWARATGSQDRQRILRGLEVTLRRGVPMSAILAEAESMGPRYEAVWVALSWPRERLYQRIEARVDQMLEHGWLDEVVGLLDQGYTRASPGLRAIGYRELVAHLCGEISIDDARRDIARATRNYAKRQLTWFRGQTPARWFTTSDDAEASERVFDEIRAYLRAETHVLTSTPTPDRPEHAH